jgi:hypothetical protein
MEQAVITVEKAPPGPGRKISGSLSDFAGGLSNGLHDLSIGADVFDQEALDGLGPDVPALAEEKRAPVFYRSAHNALENRLRCGLGAVLKAAVEDV